jgi:hypothetical protein
MKTVVREVLCRTNHSAIFGYHAHTGVNPNIYGQGKGFWDSLGAQSVRRQSNVKREIRIPSGINAPFWDDLHVAYFDSYALWTYLTIPFLYTYPGFVTEELPLWQEDGEVWRPLRAIFPDNIASHTREQISYFGKDGLLRRHEYVVDIMGGARGLNYAYDYRKVDGVMVPVTRRVVAFDDNKRKIPNPVLAAIDIHEIAFS